jgi:two-component system sensor histidine kinase LytS
LNRYTRGRVPGWWGDHLEQRDASSQTILRDIRGPLLLGTILALMQAGVVAGILYLARPSFSWVELALLPVLAASTVGIVVWVGMGRDTFRDISRQQAVQAEGILDIVIESLPHLRQGLNPESARAVSYLIFAKLEFDAVSLTDTSRILSFVGEAENHHLPGTKIKTKATMEALYTKQVQVVNSRWNIGCPYLDCPLHSAIIAPLIVRDEAVGALKLYYARPKEIGELEEAVAMGLARLLSSQLELAELDTQRQATLSAELRALQAQINPHFLFNSLNTIAMFCRTKPAEARNLVLAFAEFFRHTLRSPQDFITISEELEYVNNYLELEKARFGPELTVNQRLAPDVLDLYIPPLTIQPLVENAVKHGKGGVGRRLRIDVEAWREGDRLHIEVKDDGPGFDPQVFKEIRDTGPSQTHGIGIFNVHRRLRAFYGPQTSLTVTSDKGSGSSVGFTLPIALCLPDDDTGLVQVTIDEDLVSSLPDAGIAVARTEDDFSAGARIAP